jgi:hypothetical protein
VWQAPAAQRAQQNRFSRSQVLELRKKSPGKRDFVAALWLPGFISLHGIQQAQRFPGDRG